MIFAFMNSEKPNIIKELCLELAGEILLLCERLEGRKKFVLANQLLRCGTSIGAHVFEAQHAESRIDFIHKMKIAAKEASETLYWLTLCQRIEGLMKDATAIEKVNQAIRIISRIIITAKAGEETVKKTK